MFKYIALNILISGLYAKQTPIYTEFYFIHTYLQY